jgi:hypothetical protein
LPDIKGTDVCRTQQRGRQGSGAGLRRQ